MHLFDVLQKPVLSEKSNEIREGQGKYTFSVRLDASKKDVKKAVESMFEVKVANVKTLIARGKIRRRGNNFSKPTKSKKAMVTLVAGDKIKLFEDQ